jgi:hypothetical protein
MRFGAPALFHLKPRLNLHREGEFAVFKASVF